MINIFSPTALLSSNISNLSEKLKIKIKTKYVLILLYQQKDYRVMSDFFRMYGCQANNDTSLMPLLTCFDEAFLDEWGDGYIDRETQQNLFRSMPAGDKYRIMGDIARSYGIQMFPALLVVEWKNKDYKNNYIPLRLNELDCHEIFGVLERIIDITRIPECQKDFSKVSEKIDSIYKIEKKEIKEVFIKKDTYKYVLDFIHARGYTKGKICDLLSIDEATFYRRFKRKTLDIALVDDIIAVMELDEVSSNLFRKELGMK